ncbi:MAG TPA: DUF3857 domain-containing protein [Pyrinomonadaceae bacterium]|jgi:hypothetical protein|nr:DUF3857 domain-containing protein [Pyrinomonadaceae bacterium]
MNIPRSLVYFSLALCCLTMAMNAPTSALAYGDGWKPIDPSELALKAPVVEKDADAEALFWEVYVADEAEGGDPRTVLKHYIRIKIFTDRGKESQSKIDIIPLYKNTRIKDVAGRTVKPDGSIIELKKEDVHERTLIKANGIKVKATSFAMPGVETGSIIEYRWREERGDHLTFYDRLQFQRDIPVQTVKYYIKPISVPGFDYGMRAQFFNGKFKAFTKEKEGFYSTTLNNVPAFHVEPRMPPEDQERIWMLVYYSEDKKLNPDQFFKDYGKRMYDTMKPLLKVNDEIRKKSAELVGGATSPEEQLSKLFEFCRTGIKRIYDDANGMTGEQRVKLAKEIKSPSETLKRGMGTDQGIDTLFGALAVAAGMEVRVANMPDRSDIFFDKSIADDYFLNTYAIAVKVGSDWRFFSPSNTYLPYGMLPWTAESQPALILDSKEPVFVDTPLSTPKQSLEKRTAKLTLSDDGTLEGDVRIEYTGHLAAEKKEYNDDDSPTQREETLRTMVKERMSTAELSNVQIENVADPVKPFIYAYHVKVPGYAQRTGKRLFLQPAFFEHGAAPLFPTSERKHAVYFNYPWSEEDDVEIILPEGFKLDNADTPGGVNAGEISQFDIKIMITKDERTLIYKRKFFFGGGGNILFPTTAYPALKQYFDALNKADNHTLSIKQGGTTAAAPAKP